MRTRNFNFSNNSNVTILRRRNRGHAPNVVEPELRTIVEVAPMAERTMEELLRAPTEGYGEAIVLPEINADHFEIKTNLLQLVQANPFHAGGNLLSKTTREALNIIENKSKVRYSRNKSNVSRMNTTSRESVSKTDERIDKLADQISTLVEIVSKKVVTPAPVKAVEEICVTCSGPHAWYNCPNTDNNQSSVCAATGSYNQVNPQNRVSNQMAPPGFAPVQNNGQNSGFFQNQASTSGTLSSNTIPNPKGEMKAITTQSGVAYEGPSIPTNPSPKKVVERETEETTDKEQSNFQGSTAHIPPPVNPIPILEPDVPKTLPKLNIPYPSRRNDQKFHEKASYQKEKIFQMFQDLRFEIRSANALLLMLRFAPMIRNLLMNKEKLLELAKIPLNENCSAMLLKNLPAKVGDPDKFLIPCNFPRMDVCHALADLGASINLMPLSIWKKLSLPELTPTRMTLELADRSITHPKGLAEDVFVKVGKFHFPTDFVVVDFDADPRHVNESIKMVNDTCKDRFEGTNNLSSGDTTPLSDFHLSLKFFKTSKSLLERFTDEPALVCLPLLEDDNDEKEKQEVKNIAEPTAKRQTRITPCLKNFKPKDSLIMGDEHLSTFRVEEIVPIPRESEDTFDNNMIFSNPLFCSKDNLTSRDDESFLKEDVQEENFQVYSNPLFEIDNNHNSSNINPLFNEMLEDVKSKDSNVSNFDEPNDPLHYEFAGEIITNPSRIAREHEEYISRMWLLCGNSSSRSPENFHASPNTIIESLPTFPISVQDSDSHREEIDIFPGPDDSIPQGIESYFDTEEEIIFLDNLLNDDIFVPEYERFTVNIEPDVPVTNNFNELNEDECFDLGGGEINVKFDDSFTFFIRTFLPFLTYPEVSPLLLSTRNEDTIFDPDIST
ncbi:reverse transcriptase domain-containing protein [Tanacetum coccineum]|uniref:Reverse transcriptase domain-containing protein n=1 Tax=Tanacetum coccineum TaxID=301880 RepID=A0ABQ5I4R2_9ASTR